MTRSARPVDWSARVYNALLRAYPQSFRQDYGDEMVLVFRELASHAWDRGGWLSLAGVWLRVFVDLARSLPQQYRLAFKGTLQMKTASPVKSTDLIGQSIVAAIAKRFWIVWAHLALAILIAVQVLFIAFAMIKIVPSYEKYQKDGFFDGGGQPDLQQLLSRADSCLLVLLRIVINVVNYWPVWLILAVVVWGLFEWRVRSESKSFMRLSAMSMMALLLAVGVGLTASSLLVPFVVAVPTLYVRMPEPIVRDQDAIVRKSISELEQAMVKADWKSSREHATKAWMAVSHLSNMGATAPALVSLPEQAKVDEVRANLKSASEFLFEAQNAMLQEDSGRVNSAMQKFHDAYGQVPGAAKDG